MLSFDARELDAKAIQVEGALDAEDPVWQAGDPRPSGAIHVSGRLSAAGTGRYFWSGRFRGAVEVDCRRCLEPVVVEFGEAVQSLFAEEGDQEADDPDVYRVDPRTGEVDLRPVLREQWLLSVPAYALCDEACKGLCPTCGADLNTSSCTCPPAADTRWDALRSKARDRR